MPKTSSTISFSVDLSPRAAEYLESLAASAATTKRQVIEDALYLIYEMRDRAFLGKYGKGE